jgi:hypothetical protein
MERNKTIDPQALLVWLESKPADEAYDFWDVNNCLFAQFGRETYPLAEGESITGGGHEFNVWDNWGHYRYSVGLPISNPDSEIASGFGSDRQSTKQVRPLWTFGQAAQRLRDAMAANVQVAS